MPCGVCGCACRTGGEAPNGELDAPLPDIETGSGQGAAPLVAQVSPLNIAIHRVSLFLVWVYLLDLMRRFAMKHTDGDIWFSTLAVVLMALPVTEYFLITAMCEHNPDGLMWRLY
ncbi:hypothetical protein ACQJBY_031971 [Aegilops geniculata]